MYSAYKVFTEGDFTPPVSSIPQKYLGLFSDSCFGNMKILQSKPNKERDTVSLLNYQNDKYRILIFQLRDTTSLSLDKYISQENIPSGLDVHVYETFGFGKSTFDYLPKESFQEYDSIIFKHCCDSMKYSVEQKDRAYFSGSFSSALICKGKSTDEDLVFTTGLRPCLLSIMFLYKEKKIFFIAMTPNNDNDKMDSKLLWNCIKG